MRIKSQEHKRRYVNLSARGTLFLAILLVLIVGTASFAFASTEKSYHSSNTSMAQNTLATNGAGQWMHDVQTMKSVASFSLLASKQVTVSSLFNTYYKRYENSNSLGNPVTFAFPIDGGWLQFFESGALFLPTQPQKHALQNTKDMLSRIINNGTKDPATDVVRLPLLQALLTVGSLAPIDGQSSTLSYADVRKATDPGRMLTASAVNARAALSINPIATDGRGMFVKGGVRAGKAVGHVVLQSFWDYINRPEISPDGWQKDFGIPLTDALPFTISRNGSTHKMIAQVFTQGGLLYDPSIPASSGQTSISRLNVGLDYLLTFGLPMVTLTTGQAVWSQGDTSVLNHPGTGQEIIHVGQDFPFTLLGSTVWSGGRLWYNVQWSVLKKTYKGWIDGAFVTFTSPGNGAGRASFDVLSPDLIAYLNGLGPNVSATLYDVTHNTYYTYNTSTQFIVASSMKVPIMLTFLDMVEQQGREPDDNEMSLLTTMIENSNNDSASALFDAVGGADGIAAYMQKIGVNGLSPDGDSWGFSLTSSQTMVDLLTRLYQGKVLNATHRSLALNLMENVEPDQQVGIGDTAPAGATVALKDGWVPGPDGQWAMNSSGIVTTDEETYILSVYTQEQQSLDDGQAITRHVCNAVAALITP